MCAWRTSAGFAPAARRRFCSRRRTKKISPIFSRGSIRAFAVTIVGVGSNLLVRDGGIEGVVIRLGEGLPRSARRWIARRSRRANSRRQTRDAAAEAGIAGLAFYRGIPGAVGGALRMNAGAYGAETKDEALCGLAWCFQEGTGTEKNELKAEEIYKKYTSSTKQEDPDSVTNLARCFHFGAGTEKSPTKAVEMYKLAVSQGCVRAMNILGFCYQNGYGTEQDEKKAVEFYTMAADRGQSLAKYNLACCYESGSGVEKSTTMAFTLFSRAAELGNGWAQNSLGLLYEWEKVLRRILNKPSNCIGRLLNKAKKLR